MRPTRRSGRPALSAAPGAPSWPCPCCYAAPLACLLTLRAWKLRLQRAHTIAAAAARRPSAALLTACVLTAHPPAPIPTQARVGRRGGLPSGACPQAAGRRRALPTRRPSATPGLRPLPPCTGARPVHPGLPHFRGACAPPTPQVVREAGLVVAAARCVRRRAREPLVRPPVTLVSQDRSVRCAPQRSHLSPRSLRLPAVRSVVGLLAGTWRGSHAAGERQLARRAMMLNCDGQGTALSGALVRSLWGPPRRIQAVSRGARWQRVLLQAQQARNATGAPCGRRPCPAHSSPQPSPRPAAAVVMCHVRGVLLNAPDNGWLHTSLMEVECMRAQYQSARSAGLPGCGRSAPLQGSLPAAPVRARRSSPALLAPARHGGGPTASIRPASAPQCGPSWRRPRCWSAAGTCCSPATCSCRWGGAGQARLPRAPLQHSVRWPWAECFGGAGGCEARACCTARPPWQPLLHRPAPAQCCLVVSLMPSVVYAYQAGGVGAAPCVGGSLQAGACLARKPRASSPLGNTAASRHPPSSRSASSNPPCRSSARGRTPGGAPAGQEEGQGGARRTQRRARMPLPAARRLAATAPRAPPPHACRPATPPPLQAGHRPQHAGRQVAAAAAGLGARARAACRPGLLRAAPRRHRQVSRAARRARPSAHAWGGLCRAAAVAWDLRISGGCAWRGPAPLPRRLLTPADHAGWPLIPPGRAGTCCCACGPTRPASATSTASWRGSRPAPAPTPWPCASSAAEGSGGRCRPGDAARPRAAPQRARP